jgi:hypothetical protein
MRRLTDVYSYAGYPADALAGWSEDVWREDLPDILRSAMRREYADASDEEMRDSLETVLGAISPAEAFNFGSALNQIGRQATKLAADPTFAQVVRIAAPVAAGMIGGPGGAALGSLAVNALLPAAPAPPSVAPPSVAPPSVAPPLAATPPAAGGTAAPPLVPAPPPPAAVLPSAAPVALPSPAAPVALPSPALPAPGARVADGSRAAAQALVLTQQADLLRGLLATALGRHGCQQVSGVPIAKVLALAGRVFEQAAVDADKLMYLQQQPDAAEGLTADWSAGPPRLRYADLLGADNLQLAEAIDGEVADQ